MNLDIIYSSKCNIACQYCPYQQDDNKHIREQIKCGNFSEKVIEAINDEITSLSIRGAEPAVNFDLFPAFIKPILAAKPQINELSIYTNGSRQLYRSFVEPMIKLPIKVNIIIQVDGPAAIADFNKAKGSYAFARDSIMTLIRMCSTTVHGEFELHIKTESIINKFNMSNDSKEWYDWAQSFRTEMSEYAVAKPYIHTEGIGATPRLEIPGRYFRRDVMAYKRWFKEPPRKYCSDSQAIDCNGIMYDCYLKKYKSGYNEHLLRSNFDKRVDDLLKLEQITQTDKDALFEQIMTVWCWATAPDINIIDDSYIMLFGNL